jgi:hypothetical protein
MVMGKYAGALSDILSIFATAEWQSTNLKASPKDYVSVNQGNEFLKIDIIASGGSVNGNSLSGLLMIDIFTSAGKGPMRTSEIADILDSYLTRKSVSGVTGKATQFGDSVLSPTSPDADNPSLSRTTYTITFNYFGVN